LSPASSPTICNFGLQVLFLRFSPAAVLLTVTTSSRFIRSATTNAVTILVIDATEHCVVLPLSKRASPVFLLYTRNLGAVIVGVWGSSGFVGVGNVGFGFVLVVGFFDTSYNETFTFDIGVSPSPFLPSYWFSFPTLPSTHTLPEIFIVKSITDVSVFIPGFFGGVILSLCCSIWYTSYSRFPSKVTVNFWDFISSTGSLVIITNGCAISYVLSL